MSEAATVQDRRQWALTVMEPYGAHDFERLGEATANAVRAIGAEGLIMGLVDLAAHLAESIVDHGELGMAELIAALRYNAEGELHG